MRLSRTTLSLVPLLMLIGAGSANAGGPPTPPIVEYAWGTAGSGTDHVMMTPVVIQLDGGNADIVFMTFAGSDWNNNTGAASTLRAISVVGGAVVEKPPVSITGTSADKPGRAMAAGNIDGAAGNEIVVCTRDDRVRAYTATGSELWLSSPIGGTCTVPSLADIDQDGDVEVIVRSVILSGTTGAVESTLTPANNSNVVVSDVDGDGVLDVVSPGRAYDAAGALIVDSTVSGTQAAVADLDKDGVPEVISVNTSNHTLAVWHVDPNEPAGYDILRQGVDITNGLINACCIVNPNSVGCIGGGGPPAVADFDGDGFPDVGISGGFTYTVFNGASLMNPGIPDAGTVAWVEDSVQDCGSAQTGSSAFDFDGDGLSEIVHADEVKLRVLDGATGTTLFETCNTSGTLWEYPVLADVTGDGSTNIVVPSNSYSSLNCSGVKTAGIRIFGDSAGAWAATRSIWNQHGYHVTNVLDDGTIPTVELPHYAGGDSNSFRSAAAPAAPLTTPVPLLPLWAVGTLVVLLLGVASRTPESGRP